MDRFQPNGFEPALPLNHLRVAVLCGGDSAEREVSLASGQAVCDALLSRGHQAERIDPQTVDLPQTPWDEFDAAFVALHGEFGEDGQVQSLLEDAGVPFTGSDASASRLAISKSASKERFLQEGLATPAYVLIHSTDNAARIELQARKPGLPAGCQTGFAGDPASA